jgi:hypothetical protein
MTGQSDTSPDVERMMSDIYRRMPAARKFALLEDANRTCRALHATGYRARNPEATGQEIWSNWLRLTLGEALAARVLEVVPMSLVPTESVRTIRTVTDVFQRLGVRCVLGGSFASTVHGYPRSTQDADLMAEPFPGREEEFTRLLGPVFYANADTIRSAVRDRGGFNVIHTTTGFKVDVFIEKRRPFDRSVLDRRTPHSFTAEPADVLDIVTAEDSILLKLEWYRIGGEVSDRQWNDITGIMKTQGDRLDAAYLDHWAGEIGVKDLLDRARQQV